MGKYVVLFVIGSFLNLFFIKVNGTCEMVNRIKTRDPDLVVSAKESPCQMVVSSNDRRQVVIVIYNHGRNCIGLGAMKISDGSIQNNTVINNACRATNISFISRRHGLIIELASPVQPFDIDLHLIDTDIVYNSQSGTIVSPRYPGSDGGYTLTTPNNFHGKYRIMSAYNVSKSVRFTEFRVEASGGCTNDLVKVMRDSTLIGEYCGDGDLPASVNSVAKEITLEFITDNFAAYTGFTVTYNICMQTVNDTYLDGTIDFPGFSSGERTCMLIIRLTRQAKIQFSLDVSTRRNCSQFIEIFPDKQSPSPMTCNGLQEVTAKDVRILFEFEGNELLKGNYSIDYSNTEQQPSGNEEASSLSNDNSATNVIVGVVVTVTFFAVVIVIVIIVFKRRQKKKNTKKRSSLRMGEIGENVYEYKEDYDHLNVKREHLKTSNDQNSNVYGRMISSEVQDEYAVANKGDKEPAEISANEYGAESFNTEYEETTKPTSEQKVLDDNVYE